MNRNFLFIAISTLGLMYCGGKALQTPSEKKDGTTGPKSLDLGKERLVTDSLEFDETYLLGQFEPSKHQDFSSIPQQYTTKQGVYLRTDALQAFIQMHEAAAKEGISLKIISATRNFNSQKGIWEAKWNGSKIVEGKNLATEVRDTTERAKFILRYSSMPGTSRHHWGTDIDINDLNDAYFLKGQGQKEYEWLVKNAASFGFCQPYSPKGEARPNGYEEEKWHWTYYPVSAQLTRQYKAKITPERIKGFAGAGTAITIDVITNYVLGINADCLD